MTMLTIVCDLVQIAAGAITIMIVILRVARIMGKQAARLQPNKETEKRDMTKVDAAKTRILAER